MTVGQLAARSGLSVATLQFYEKEGLIRADRDDSNYRRFHRSVLRRLAVIRVAQRVGLSLSEIRASFHGFRDDEVFDVTAWRRLSSAWASILDAKIADLKTLREGLADCIGCGCLSLDKCELYNPEDRLAADGPGARLWETRGRN